MDILGVQKKNVNIILIGFMATGKTAVGRALARKLKKKYISTDALIEKKARKKIRTIFRESGEAHFRGLETKALRSLKGKKGLVVSCGGGIVLRPENRALLKKAGTVVWLKASPDAVNARLGKLKQRPLLDISDTGERLKKIRRMMKDREALYRSVCDRAVDTDRLSVAGVTAAITDI